SAGQGPARSRNEGSVPLRHGPGRHRRPQRLLPARGPAGEVQPPAGSGRPDEEREAKLGRHGRGGGRPRGHGLGGSGDDMIDRETEVRPRAADGRNIDQTIGSLRGEGALQRVAHLAEETPFQRPPAAAEGASYYGLPLLKE